MSKFIRTNEYSVFFYRIFLAYFFYFIARLLFFLFNKEIIGEISISQLSKLFLFGIQFDTTAILYINLLFILMSIIPLRINTTKTYQKILFWIYFLTNGIAYATNFVDMIYFPFSKSRLTTASFAVVENEQNKTTMFFTFLGMYWYVVLIFILLISLWIFLYKKKKVQEVKIANVPYFVSSVLILGVIGVGVLAGIRGGSLAHSSRPINILDASRHVTISSHADVILNTPFTLIRTIGKNKSFKEYNFVSEDYIQENIKPIKHYHREMTIKPNVVIFILESFGREYVGCMNTNRNIPDYKSYTPFLDSLSKHSFVFDNAYANGRQSIHGMSSVYAGIPTFQVAYTSSPYVQQPTESVISIAKEMGYNTSFFHSAPNGSMGFLGFSNILGFDNYYGMTEYGNDADFDGFWGIWDEPFLQFMNQEFSKKKQPFLGTIFTVSSHHPYKIPEKYEGKFDKGDVEMHQCIQYTDYALKKFFESAKKEEWYKNTIFVFTNDHHNQVYYPLYKQPITGNGATLMFFSPNLELVGKGISSEISQQIDLYPSVVDLMGYNKPFRSWGRSLFSAKKETPRAYISDAHVYRMMQGNYIYILNEDGSVNGIFKKEDEGLTNNILGKENNPEIEKGIKDLQAFMQDYMHRIIQRKLGKEGN
ncbi:LTA synthase family protein [Capnocytophaga stomatis]|uniref:LTA synthase family protein n=1 Tax=Capnocytophaga stomatis TaxID=1848904 RepID=UPI001AC3808A|nr:LTA synthase family protein [Capnocytophaga stomatis]GIM50831.1 sulfatase [Capnocytophaga stomatis]